MTKETELKNILSKLQNFCSRAEKCSSDILSYLDKFEISQADKHKILKSLKDEKFVDDSRYTIAYINDKFKFNKWGKIKIVYSLKAKNIEESVIYENINAIDSEDYYNTLEILLNQKIRQSKKADSTQIKQLLIRFAYSRGFEYELTEKVIKTILK
jgi:regulatory protein